MVALLVFIMATLKIFDRKKLLNAKGLLGDNVIKNPARWSSEMGSIFSKRPETPSATSKWHTDRLAEFFGNNCIGEITLWETVLGRNNSQWDILPLFEFLREGILELISQKGFSFCEYCACASSYYCHRVSLAKNVWLVDTSPRDIE